MKTITVVSVDDHHLIRVAIRSLLNEREDMEFVGEGAVGEDIVPLVEQYRPDVLLLDIGMPQSRDQNGERFKLVSILDELRTNYPDMGIIILTQYDIPALVKSAMQQGVQGYLLKSDDLSLNLPEAIQAVAKGSVYFSETVSQRVFGNDSAKDKAPILTSRQMEVLNAIFSSPNLSYAKHAANLKIRESTFKSHLTKAFKALDVNGATAAMLRCIELGIIAPP